MRYFLIGLPGSGKSHWAKIWAEKIKAPYYDLDEIIENNEGFSIQEIFENDGEEHFRNLETFYLNKLIGNFHSIMLSTGGGTACFNGNLELMNSKGRSIYLNQPLNEIALRIWRPDQNKRPLFSKCNNKEEVLNLLQELQSKRESFYKQANFTIVNPNPSSIRKIQP